MKGMKVMKKSLFLQIFSKNFLQKTVFEEFPFMTFMSFMPFMCAFGPHLT